MMRLLPIPRDSNVSLADIMLEGLGDSLQTETGRFEFIRQRNIILWLATGRDASISRIEYNSGMNAYFFTASTTRSQIRLANLGRGQSTDRFQRWSSCDSLIVCAENADTARKQLEEWLCTQPEGQNPIETEINRIVGAQFIGQLLTETGFVPLDWLQISKEAQSDLESTPADDLEQGYWVEVNALLLPSSSIKALCEDLPEDIRSGLNWSENKQFLFLLSILSPPPLPQPESEDVTEAAPRDPMQPPTETGEEFAGGLGEQETDFVGLVEKEAAVLIRARNSAVAAWLWRQYAADTKLAENHIRIDPWCGVVGIAT